MNSRKLARQIVQRVLEEGAYSNLVLSKELNREEIDFGEGPVPSLLTRIGVNKEAYNEVMDLIKSPDF